MPHNIPRFCNPAIDRVSHSVEPWPAIGIIECYAPRIFSTFLRRMETVRIQELPTLCAASNFPNRRLARSGDTHHDHDHAELLSEINSPSITRLCQVINAAIANPARLGPVTGLMKARLSPPATPGDQPYNFRCDQAIPSRACISQCFWLGIRRPWDVREPGQFSSVATPRSTGNPFIAIAVLWPFCLDRRWHRLCRDLRRAQNQQQAALQQASPDSPWLWREDWSASHAESKNRNTAIGLWIAAIFWNAISIRSRS